MDKLVLIQEGLWLLILVAVVIGIALLAKYVHGLLTASEKPTEANPHVDTEIAKEALGVITSGEATPEEQAMALKQYFETAQDPNPQGFFARLWSIF